MVKSIINDNINYHEYSHLEKEDFNYNTPLYNLKILGITVIIGVGQLNYRYSKRYGVVYVPIYLFNANYEFVKQIGLYEMSSNEIKMDQSGDIEINKLKPLLYSTFVNTTLLRQSLVKTDKSSSAPASVSSVAENKKKEEINKNTVVEIKKSLGKSTTIITGNEADDSDDDTDDAYMGTGPLYGVDAKQAHMLSGATILPLQTKDQSELERKQYKHNLKDLWIQKFLRNKYFNFIDNEGGSDSLFAVIRDALLTQGRATTINELRKQLSHEVTDETFKKYREKYAMYHGIIKTQNGESKNKIEQYNDYKRRISSTHDRAQQQLMIAGAKKLAIEHNMKIDEIKYTKLLSSQYDYMKEVRNIDQLKERIQTSLYWPDNWAISTLERILNMKFIFFSSTSYDAGDIENVLECGGVDMIDPLILKKSVFEPTAYIIIDKGLITPISSSKTHSLTASATTNKHMYRLITYKTHGIFAFSEVPYDIKLLITTKCLESQSGSFCMIPQFKLFQKELGIRIDNNGMQSVEHYYQGSKFKNNNREFYLKFSLDSRSELSSDPMIAKAAGSKNGKMNGAFIRPSNITVDPDFFSHGRGEREMSDAIYAKFSQNKNLKDMLLATRNAKLVQYLRGTQSKVFHNLMQVRHKLRTNTK